MDTRPSRLRSHTSHELQRNTCSTQWLMQQMRRMSHELNVQKNIFDHEIKRIQRRRLTNCDRHLLRFLSSRHENFQTIGSRLSLILDRLKKRLSLVRSRNTPERSESSSRRIPSVTDTERREVIIVHRQEELQPEDFKRLEDTTTGRVKQGGEGISRNSDHAEIKEDEGQRAVAGTSQEGQRSHSQQESIVSESSATNRSRSPSRVSMESNFRLEKNEHPRESSGHRESQTEKKSAKELKEKTVTAAESSRPRSRDHSHSTEEPRSREEEREQPHSDSRQRSLRVSTPSSRSYQGRSTNLSSERHERFTERQRNWSTERDRHSVRSLPDYYNRQYNVIFVPVNYEENYPLHWNPGYDLSYPPPPHYGPEIWYTPQYMRGIMPRGRRGPYRRFHRSPS